MRWGQDRLLELKKKILEEPKYARRSIYESWDRPRLSLFSYGELPMK